MTTTIQEKPQVFKKTPGVLSFQRGLLITDALFYNQTGSEVKPDGMTPVDVVRHGIRGTQNVNKGTEEKRDVSNIQTTDTAKTDPNAEGVLVMFDIRSLDLDNCLYACARSKEDKDQDIAGYRDSVVNFIKRAKESEAVDLIAQRYARNIANGRWLWRNRTIAKKITVSVTAETASSAKHVASFDALNVSTRDFDAPSKEERQLASYLADGLRGYDDTGLSVCALVKFGVDGAVEVHPSQNYVENKPRGFARTLYALGEAESVSRKGGVEMQSERVMGQAALRDQKVGNAIRTIDTWYEDADEYGRPIAVEPNGASLDAQKFFRSKKTSAFEYARRLNTLDPTSDEGLFMLANLIRGGVFSES